MSCSWGRSKPATLVENSDRYGCWIYLRMGIGSMYGIVSYIYHTIKLNHVGVNIPFVPWIRVGLMHHGHGIWSPKNFSWEARRSFHQVIAKQSDQTLSPNVGSFTFFSASLKKVTWNFAGLNHQTDSWILFGWIFDECTELTGQGLFLKKIRPPRFPFVASCVPSRSTWGHKLSWMWRRSCGWRGWGLGWSGTVQCVYNIL